MQEIQPKQNHHFELRNSMHECLYDRKFRWIERGAFIESFVEQIENFGAQQSWPSKEMLVMPIDRSDYAGYRCGVEKVLLISTSKGQRHEFYDKPLIQFWTVMCGLSHPLQILSGVSGQTADMQVTDVMDRVFPVWNHPTILATSSMHRFDGLGHNAELKKLDVPEALQPLQFYQVTGGRLSTLLFG